MAYFRKRGKKWYYTIEVRDESGHRKKVERVGGLTKAACEKAYAQQWWKSITQGSTANPPK